MKWLEKEVEQFKGSTFNTDGGVWIYLENALLRAYEEGKKAQKQLDKPTIRKEK